MQIRNVTKAATFKSLLYQSYKSAVTFFVIVHFNSFHDTIFWGYTKTRLFKPTTRLQDGYFLRNFQNFRKSYFQVSSSITEVYSKPNRKSTMDFLVKTVKSKRSLVDIWRGSKYASALVMNVWCSVSALWWIYNNKLKK